MQPAARLGIGHVFFAAMVVLAALAADSAAQGRIKWRYVASAAYFSMRPAIAPDGTVYAVDINGTLHAVAPDGKPRWTLVDAGRKGVSVGADGTVYTGGQTKIVAVRPNGTVKWTYPISPVAHTLLGPSVGPDGNIYANAASGPGLLSLTPAGQLRWSTPARTGRPWVQSQELVFRPAAANRPLQVIYSGHGTLAQIDTRNGNVTVVSTGGDSQPFVGPNGDVYSTGSLELRAFRPDTTLRWRFRSTSSDTISDPTVGPGGVVYVVRRGRLHALRQSDGQPLWEHWDFSSLLRPVASPTGKMVLVAGRTRGTTDFVRAVDPRGRLMWQVDLRTLGSAGAFPTTPARFTSDGRTAYVGAMVDNIRCYLFAIDTSAAHRADVWTYGTACPGVSRQMPRLGFRSRPVLGGTLSVELSNARASAPAAHVMGLTQTRVDFLWRGAPGCYAYTTPDAALPLRTDAQGRAATSLPVPNDPALAGVTLFHQFLITDPVNRLGVVATSGGGSIFGR